MTTETKPAMKQTDPYQFLEAGPPQSAAIIIDQFRSDIGLPNSSCFDITNNGVRVIYKTIAPAEKKLGERRLSASMDMDYAAAAVDSEGKSSIGWARHDIDITKHEDTLVAEQAMKRLLSYFFPTQ